MLIVAAIAIFLLGRCSASEPTSELQSLSADPTVVDLTDSPGHSSTLAPVPAVAAVMNPSEDPVSADLPLELVSNAEPEPEGLSCGTKTTCREMNSCAEAHHYLNQCGVSRLDGDGDGVPCESICS